MSLNIWDFSKLNKVQRRERQYRRAVLPAGPTQELGMYRRCSVILVSVFLAAGVAIGGSMLRPYVLLAQDVEQSQTVNVELIFDVSGSMAQQLPTGETRMEAAKAVLTDLVNGIPEGIDVNVGLRIYGHEGDNTDEGQAVSCQSSELVVPIVGVEKEAITSEINALQPTGWTPLALSLEKAEADFPVGDGVTNAVVLVTDGLETCNGDPCAAAGGINIGESNIVTHVVGFALTPEEQALLGCIAESGQGLLLGADNADELTSSLFTVFVEELEIPVTPVPEQTIPINFANGTFEVGETFETDSGPFEVAVTGYSEAESMSFGFDSADARGKFVAVELTVTNPGRSSVVLEYDQFRLYTVSTDRITDFDTDATIPAQIGLYDIDLYAELQPGITYATVVIFDVAVESEGYWLLVGGNGDNADQGVRLSGNSVPESEVEGEATPVPSDGASGNDQASTVKETTSGSVSLDVGETFETDSGPFEVAVTGYSEAESMSFGFDSADARGKFVAVELTVTNPGRSSVVLEYDQFRLYTVSTDRITDFDTDATIPAQIGLYDIDLYAELQPGITYATVVIFDVAVESEGYWLLVGGNGDNANQAVRLSGDSLPPFLD